MTTTTLGFMGMGKMAQAIVTGLKKTPLINHIKIIFYDPATRSNHPMDCQAVSLSELTQKSDFLFLCMKPQQLPEALASIPTPFPCKGLISILAGISIDQFPYPKSPICRVMPNAPAVLGQGITALSFNDPSPADFKVFIAHIFEALGKVVHVHESAMHAVTALSGSGPAFFYRIIRSFCQAGQQLGLSESLAKHLVTQTMIGSGYMVNELDQPLDTLIDTISSPGGTTLAGLSVFDQHDIDGLLAKVIQGAAKRSQELGGNK